MNEMIEAIVGVAVFFVLLGGIVLSNYQSARDATTDSDVEMLIYLVLLLFLVGAALAFYKKMQ